MYLSKENQMLLMRFFKTEFLLFLFLLCSFSSIGQETVFSKKSDSLVVWSYEKLQENYIKYFDSAPVKAKLFAKSYIEKAKLEKNSKQLQEGYVFISYLVDYETAIKYCDSTLKIAAAFDDKETLARTNFLKGGYHFDNKNLKEALNSFLKADELAYAVEGEEWPYFIKYSIGTLKVRLSKHEEAKEIFKECRSYLEDLKGTEPYNNFYLSTMKALSNSYRRLKQLDSSSIINRLGYQEAKIIKDDKSLSYFIFNEGVNNLEKRNYEIALDSMQKGLNYFEEKQSNSNLIVAYYYMGRAHDELDDENKGIYYFRKVDSLFETTKDLKPETRGAYDRMIAYYRKREENDKLLETIESLLQVDSVLNANYRYLNTYIIKKYDTPQLLIEKEKLINSLNKGKKSISRWLYLLILLLGMASITVLYYIKKQNEYKRRFEELLKSSKPNSQTAKSSKKVLALSKNEKTEFKNIGISEELVHEIQGKLDLFVENKGYLENSITLNSLSKQLNTNSKYLSKLINHYEQKNFSKYINDLRIDYTVERLQTNQKFRNYAIKAIADEVGFNNTESFSKAFYKKTGIYPSFFIKQLEKSGNY